MSTPFDPAAHGWRQMAPAGAMPASAGLPWTRRDGDGRRYAMLTGPEHANPQGAVHGGMLMTFVDHGLSMLAWEAADRAACSTIQLNGHFLAAVQPGEFLELEGEITRKTRSMVFVRGKLRVGDRDVLAADGIWRILRGR